MSNNKPKSIFTELLISRSEDLLKKFYVFKDAEYTARDKRLATAARKIGIRPEQLIVAVGFNPYFRDLPELLPSLSCNDIEELNHRRNELFIHDIYRKLSLNNILAVYSKVKTDPDSLQIMQYLMSQRLENIESSIEENVNSAVIEKYKKEIRAIYSDGVGDIDFAEKRLDRLDSGFRALLNEVCIIIENRVIPAGDIFFRDTILPEEKRKLLNKGFIPSELISLRLEDERISNQERRMLNDYMSAMKHSDLGNA